MFYDEYLSIASSGEEGRGRIAKTFQINLKGFGFFFPSLLRFFRFGQRTREAPSHIPTASNPTSSSTEVFLRPNSWSRHQPWGSGDGAALHGPCGRRVQPLNFLARDLDCLGMELQPVAAPARRQASAARELLQESDSYG